MSKLLLKILTLLSGMVVLAYLTKRNLKIWEVEVIEAERTQPKIKHAPAQKKPAAKKPPAKKPPTKKTTASSKDDLKKIKGIGPVLEKQLHAMGIKTYQQLAQLSAQDIEKFEVQMNGFSGRVERENWIEQAKTLSK